MCIRDSPVTGSDECYSNSDCPEGYDCIKGTCKENVTEKKDLCADSPCAPGHKCIDKGHKVDCVPIKNESWLKGNKDKLLFETLMKKWTK